MAEAILVDDRLTEELIQMGATLLELLEKVDVKVIGAFWLLQDEQRIWRLYVAAPDVGRLGPKAMYRKIRTTLAKYSKGAAVLGTGDITVLDEHAPLYLQMRTAFKRRMIRARSRMPRTLLDREIVDGAYLYFVT